MIGVLAALAVVASFDCAKAAHPLEKTICSDPALAYKDARAAYLYRLKLDIVFDRTAFRQQQREWQRRLREDCAKTCSKAAVSAAYDKQITWLSEFAREEWEANYKTADFVSLAIVHQDAKRFAFEMLRGTVDDDTKSYCKIPESEADDLPIATIKSAGVAEWAEGGCKITFALSRNLAGDVGGITVSTTPMCKTWCSKKGAMFDDNFYAGNDWTAKAP
jgi:uncharacterized protein